MNRKQRTAKVEAEVVFRISEEQVCRGGMREVSVSRMDQMVGTVMSSSCMKMAVRRRSILPIWTA